MGYSYSSRNFFGGPAAHTVRTLLIVNIAVFVLQLVGDVAGLKLLEPYFGLVPFRVTHDLMVWQLVTYMFLHGGFFHILFNMITLYMFGNELERHWGSRRFATYYFTTGIGAGICSWIVDVDGATVIIGASGAIYGLLLAYGVLYPNRIIYLNFLLPIKVKWFVVIMGAMAFFSSISGGQPGVAHVAHLGGMAVGYVFLRGKSWVGAYQAQQSQKRREELRRQFEVYYGEMRRKIEDENKRGPTIH
jgi:membrane associated rhomboid family serine protease